MTHTLNTVTALRVTIPDNDVRNPLVLVDLSLGDMCVVRVGMQRRKSGLVMHRPRAADGSEGLSVGGELWQRMADAALAIVLATPDAKARIIDVEARHPSGVRKHNVLEAKPVVLPPSHELEAAASRARAAESG